MPQVSHDSATHSTTAAYLHLTHSTTAAYLHLTHSTTAAYLHLTSCVPQPHTDRQEALKRIHAFEQLVAPLGCGQCSPRPAVQRQTAQE